MRQLWLAVHHHRHGVDTFFLRATLMPSDAQFIDACNIDYEPERDEDLEIIAVNESKIPEFLTAEELAKSEAL